MHNCPATYDVPFQPYLEDKFRIHDTCGVHNLHGMPAVLGTIISIIMAARANTDLYGKAGSKDTLLSKKTVVKGCVNRSFNHATFDHVFLARRIVKEKIHYLGNLVLM